MERNLQIGMEAKSRDGNSVTLKAINRAGDGCLYSLTWSVNGKEEKYTTTSDGLYAIYDIKNSPFDIVEWDVFPMENPHIGMQGKCRGGVVAILVNISPSENKLCPFLWVLYDATRVVMRTDTSGVCMDEFASEYDIVEWNTHEKVSMPKLPREELFSSIDWKFPESPIPSLGDAPASSLTVRQHSFIQIMSNVRTNPSFSMGLEATDSIIKFMEENLV